MATPKVNRTGNYFEETLYNFLGKRNIGDATKYKVKKGSMFLVTALNIDIDNNFSMMRRKGKNEIISGNYKDLWFYGEDLLAIKNERDLVKLSQVGGSWTDTILMPGFGGTKVVYADTGRGVYMTNGAVIKKYYNGTVSTLPSVTENMKFQMPAGTIIEYWMNSLLVGSGSRVYMSDINKFEQVDGRTGIKAFSGNVTMIEGISTGLWIGTTEGVWFLFDTGEVGKEIGDIKFKHFHKLSEGVIKGSSAKVYDIYTPTNKHYVEGVIFATENGIYIGGLDGEYEPLTEGKYEFPSNIREASAVFRKVENLDQYMVIFKY